MESRLRAAVDNPDITLGFLNFDIKYSVLKLLYQENIPSKWRAAQAFESKPKRPLDSKHVFVR